MRLERWKRRDFCRFSHSVFAAAATEIVSLLSQVWMGLYTWGSVLELCHVTYVIPLPDGHWNVPSSVPSKFWGHSKRTYCSMAISKGHQGCFLKKSQHTVQQCSVKENAPWLSAILEALCQVWGPLKQSHWKWPCSSTWSPSWVATSVDGPWRGCGIRHADQISAMAAKLEFFKITWDKNISNPSTARFF